MSISGNPVKVSITAWNTSSNTAATGLAASTFSLKVSADGADLGDITSSGNIVEDTAGGIAAGEYFVTLTAGQNTGTMMCVNGTNSTANVTVIPAKWNNLPGAGMPETQNTLALVPGIQYVVNNLLAKLDGATNVVDILRAIAREDTPTAAALLEINKPLAVYNNNDAQVTAVPSEAFYPGVCTLPSGNLLVIYNNQAAGTIRSIVYNVTTNTWGGDSLVSAAVGGISWGDCNVALFTYMSATKVIANITGEPSGQNYGSGNSGIYVLTGTLSGDTVTWSTATNGWPIPNVNNSNASTNVIVGGQFFAGAENSYQTPVMQRNYGTGSNADASLLLPIVGKLTTSSLYTSVSYLRSTDGGNTWASDSAIVANGDVICQNFSSTSLVQLYSGAMVAIITSFGGDANHPNGSVWYNNSSTDYGTNGIGGFGWNPTDAYGLLHLTAYQNYISRNSIILLPSGQMIMTGQQQDGEPGAWYSSWDNGHSWTFTQALNATQSGADAYFCGGLALSGSTLYCVYGYSTPPWATGTNNTIRMCSWTIGATGSYTPAAASDQVLASGIAAVPIAVSGALAQVEVTVTSPVTATGDLLITQNDDYLIANNRPISFTNSAGTWAGGTISAAFLTISSGGVNSLGSPIAAASIVASGTSQAVTFQLTAAQTALLTQIGRAYIYQVLIQDATGHRETDITGAVVVSASNNP